MIIREGAEAPDFELSDQDGKTHKLSDYRGKKVVLYFYPKDDTPGCTTEACSFRDDIKKYKKKGTVIIGISTDNEESHKMFSEKYELPFPLLADNDQNIVRGYKVWDKKVYMGEEYMGIVRTTFIIDEKGIIQKIFQSVNPNGHSKEILGLL